MRRAAAAWPLALALAFGMAAGACDVSMPEDPAQKTVDSVKEAEDAETRKGCEEFKRQILDRNNGKPPTDTKEFVDIFDRLASDNDAPKEFRDAARDLGDKVVEGEPGGLEDAMGKLERKCREAGYPLDGR